MKNTHLTYEVTYIDNNGEIVREETIQEEVERLYSVVQRELWNNNWVLAYIQSTLYENLCWEVTSRYRAEVA